MLADITPPDYIWLALAGLIYAMVEVAKSAALKLAARKVEKAANRVEEKLGDVHTLVNSEHGKTLAALAVSLRTVYELSPTAENLKAAADADRASKYHEWKQSVVDEEEKPDAG